VSIRLASGLHGLSVRSARSEEDGRVFASEFGNGSWRPASEIGNHARNRHGLAAGALIRGDGPTHPRCLQFFLDLGVPSADWRSRVVRGRECRDLDDVRDASGACCVNGVVLQLNMSS
jgi:hypothetical protein